MFSVDRERFVEFIGEAVASLPDEFSSEIANVEFVVEAVATAADLRRMRIPRGSTLLGLYRGVPLTRRGAGYHMALPDTIAIFQLPLERMAHDEDDLRARVKRVVQHEVGHYFGISDERLRELGAY